MIDSGRGDGRAEPGRRLLEPTSGNTGISLALVAKLGGYPLTCVMPANVTEERRRLLRLYGAEIVESPPEEGSNGAVRVALELAERDPRSSCPSSTRTRRTRSRTTRAPVPRSRRHSTASTSSSPVSGPAARSWAPASGCARRSPRSSSRPRSRCRATRSWACARSRTATSLRSSTCRSSTEGSRLEPGVGRRPAGAARARGDLRRRLLGRSRPRRAEAGRGARRGRRCRGARGRRMEVPVRGLLGCATDVEARRDGAHRLVVVPGGAGARSASTPESEAPNEACGLIVLRDDVADRYVPGRNAAAPRTAST